MWLYKGQEFTSDMIEENVGFIYLITNITNGKMYVGKKSFSKAKTIQRNKKKKRTRVESDWVSYTGSNEQLNNDIEDGARITKEILFLAKSKGWLTYLETREIFLREAVIDPNFYNAWCMCKIRRSHLKGEKPW